MTRRSHRERGNLASALGGLIAVMAIGYFLFFKAPSDPPLVGDMSKTSICSTAGYLIRRSLGEATKTINVPCDVAVLGSNEVRIDSGYWPPLGKSMITYRATGFVFGDRLRMETIVTSVDETDEPYPFEEFP